MIPAGGVQSTQTGDRSLRVDTAPIASGTFMARESTPETLPLHADAPNFDWREWLSFVGSVLGTALVVSVVLGGIVLLLA